ncbi:hypothetical protein, partial [Enterobacter hormaechei]
LPGGGVGFPAHLFPRFWPAYKTPPRPKKFKFKKPRARFFFFLHTLRTFIKNKKKHQKKPPQKKKKKLLL